MRGHEPRSTSSCAACKFLKRRCTPNCIFAPHFRSDEPKKFAKVHKVFGASNVSKILIEVPEEQREDTVNSLVYEAEARLRDPVYGCIGAIAMLQRKMVELQLDLSLARARLAWYVDPSTSIWSDPRFGGVGLSTLCEFPASGGEGGDGGLGVSVGLLDGLISQNSPSELSQDGLTSDLSQFPIIF